MPIPALHSERLVTFCKIVLSDGQVVIGSTNVGLNNTPDLIYSAVLDTLCHTLNNVLVQSQIRWIHRFRIGFPHVVEPLLRCYFSVVEKQLLHGHPQKISMGSLYIYLLLIFFADLSLKSSVGISNDLNIWPQLIDLCRSIPYQSSTLKRQFHGLINDPAQSNQVLTLCILQPLESPIDRMRFWQSPFQRTISLVHLSHQINIQFVLLLEYLDPCFGVRVGGVQPGFIINISSLITQDLTHFARPGILIKPMGIVHVLPHLVLVQPCQLAKEHSFIWIILQSFIAK